MFSLRSMQAALAILVLIPLATNAQKAILQYLDARSETADPKLLSFDFQKSDESTPDIKGTISWNFDADESTTIAIKSAMSTDEGKTWEDVVVWPEEPLFDFLSSEHYKKEFYPAFVNCNEVYPEIVGKFEGPWRQGVFDYNGCIPQFELPNTDPGTLYTLRFDYGGQVDAMLNVLFKVIHV